MGFYVREAAGDGPRLGGKEFSVFHSDMGPDVVFGFYDESGFMSPDFLVQAVEWAYRLGRGLNDGNNK